MTKALRFTKAEISNAAQIAKAQGVSIELKPDGGMLLIPPMRGAPGIDTADPNEGSILHQWRASKNEGKAFGRPHR